MVSDPWGQGQATAALCESPTGQVGATLLQKGLLSWASRQLTFTLGAGMMRKCLLPTLFVFSELSNEQASLEVYF